MGTEKALTGRGEWCCTSTHCWIGRQRELLEAKKVVEAERGSLERLADFSFVCGLFFMKLVLSDPKQYIEYLPEIEGSYLRCLTIGERLRTGVW